MGQLLLIVVVALTIAAVVFGVTVLVSGNDGGLAPAEPDGRAVPLPSTRPLQEDDLGAVRFDTGLRGYRMAQVDKALKRAAYDIGYKDELIGVLEAEVVALREGRTLDADALRRAREAAEVPATVPAAGEEPAEATGGTGAPAAAPGAAAAGGTAVGGAATTLVAEADRPVEAAEPVVEPVVEPAAPVAEPVEDGAPEPVGPEGPEPALSGIEVVAGPEVDPAPEPLLEPEPGADVDAPAAVLTEEPAGAEVPGDEPVVADVVLVEEASAEEPVVAEEPAEEPAEAPADGPVDGPAAGGARTTS